MEVMGHHHLFLVRQSLTLAVVVVEQEPEGRVAVETVVALLPQPVELPTQAAVVAAAHLIHISLAQPAALE
jgi:hypothetical protein